ncbi:hypothetical protein H6F86_21185 [Phormidium sp. FACHB-592]|uniref:Uncharacterized protein n=1 Tax=Stenomitos frigidus AS-A4 TaxID=2933935 RepID=A0ABV0KET2_9CYAN|nr:hypothetical protein [Phormidium sp. FACHB-592]MBD2076350.1 hypothetical protein [Phormidium sp. FACHB-592]
MTNSDELRRTNIARIRGGLHDMDLTLRSPQVETWVKKALELNGLNQPIAVASLPDEALAAMANKIEQQLLKREGLAA